MNVFNSTMRRAMQLIQRGNLGAATTEIQRQLSRLSARGPHSSRGGPAEAPAIEGSFHVVDEPTRARPTRASRGRDKTNLAPQFREGSFTNSAGTRKYKLFVPQAYRGQPLPLIVMLHGCTQGPDDFAAGTRMNEIAEEGACLVLYPAQAQSANRSRCWNWFTTADQQRDRGEPSIIAGMTREIAGTYGLDAKRVYIAGLSAGGAMAVVMGRCYPELYAAVGVHSGLAYASANNVPSAFAAMKGGVARASGATPSVIVPTIVFHGDRDQTVHHRNAEQVVAAYTGIGAGARSDRTHGSIAESIVERGKIPGGYAYTRTRYVNAEGANLVEHWEVHGAGHAWFGGAPQGSYTDSKGPDASAQMMRFFLEHGHDDRVRVASDASAEIDDRAEVVS